MSSPLQKYFTQLQRELGDDVALVTDLARVLPKSRSFTVSSSQSNLSMIIRIHSDSACQQRRRTKDKKMQSVMSRATLAAAAPQQQHQNTMEDGGSQSLKNSMWSPSSQKRVYPKENALQQILGQRTPGVSIDETDGTSSPTALPIAPSSPQTTSKAETDSLLGKPSPRTIRCDLELSGSLMEDHSMESEMSVKAILPSRSTME